MRWSVFYLLEGTVDKLERGGAVIGVTSSNQHENIKVDCWLRRLMELRGRYMRIHATKFQTCSARQKLSMTFLVRTTYI